MRRKKEKSVFFVKGRKAGFFAFVLFALGMYVDAVGQRQQQLQLLLRFAPIIFIIPFFMGAEGSLNVHSCVADFMVSSLRDLTYVSYDQLIPEKVRLFLN